MLFGAALLTGLGAIFVIGLICYHYSEGTSQAGQNIFDAVKTIVPPLVSLIVGYYFGSVRPLNGESPIDTSPSHNQEE